MIDSVRELSEKALVELKTWLEPWFEQKNAGGGRGVIDSTENVGDTWGVHSTESDGDHEADGLYLRADGAGGSTWEQGPAASFEEVVASMLSAATYAWYKLPETGTDDWADSSGGGRTLTDTTRTNEVRGFAGVVEEGDGVLGVYLNASPPAVSKASSYVGARTSDSFFRFAGTAAFSVVCWVKPDFTTVGGSFSWGICGNVNNDVAGSAGTAGWGLYVQPTTDRVFFRRRSLAGTETTSITATQLVEDTWAQVVATYDGTNMKLYLNGVLEDTDASAQSLDTSAGNCFFLGACGIAEGVGGTWAPWKGGLDSVIVVNRALTQDEISTLYGGATITTGPPPAGTVVSETSYGQSSAAGTSLSYARADHTHGTPAVPTEAQVTFTDITTNDVSSAKHGYAPKSGSDATKFLNGAATPAYAAVKDSDLATTDVTTNDVTSAKHGFAPKSAGDATKFLNGAATPAYAQPKDSDLSTSDITTNDVSTSKHGFVPKAPNDTAKFLRGDGTWNTPSTLPSGSAVVATDAIWDTKGDLAAATGADAAVKVAVGSNGKVLTADSAQTAGVAWATPLTVATDTIWDTKGDLVAATGADAAVKVAAGTNYQLLQADSSQSAGVGYITRDGWIPSGDTWTYASGSGGGSATFTISGVDRTTQLAKGTRIKLTQTTAKYFVVTAVAFSTNTTVTIMAGSDYTLANATITLPFYSYEECAQGYPIFFNFAPAVTGCSGTPSVTARFQVNNGFCFIYVTIDGTSNSTSFGFSLPITCVQGGPLLEGNGQDGGVVLTAVSMAQLAGGTTTVTLRKTFMGSTSGWTNSGGKGIYLSGFYPI